MDTENEKTSKFNIENNNANIAGRDINIVKQEPMTLWDWDTQDLKLERIDCKDKRFKLIQKLIFPFVWLLCGAIVFMYIAFKTLMSFANPIFTYFEIIFIGFVCVGLPSLLISYIKKNDGYLIRYYSGRAELITNILRIRGVL